jgi:hypothetical protein
MMGRMGEGKTNRVQAGIVALCAVVGVVIVVWMVTQRQSAGGRKIVVDQARRASTVATSRVAATRPLKGEMLRALHANLPGAMEPDKVKALLVEDPLLARIEDEHVGFATPLHFVSFEGDRELAQLLLDAGAALEAREILHDGTPLEWAVFAGQVEMVKFLLNKGAKVDDWCLIVAKNGTERRAYLTTQPAKYREIQKMLVERVKASTRKVSG